MGPEKVPGLPPSGVKLRGHEDGNTMSKQCDLYFVLIMFTIILNFYIAG